MSKIKKGVDQTPSSVTSTPKTPRMDFSRVTGKIKKEKKEKDREKCEYNSKNIIKYLTIFFIVQ